jgi:hypothetical protein
VPRLSIGFVTLAKDHERFAEILYIGMCMRQVDSSNELRGLSIK